MAAYEIGSGLLLCIVGVTFACLYGRTTHGFRWRKYIALLFAPSLLVVLMAYTFDGRVLYLYVVSAIFGFLLEFGLGLAYHKTMRTPLWLYDEHAYPVWGYTSLLTLPMWGVAGVLFWTIGKLLGL